MRAFGVIRGILYPFFGTALGACGVWIYAKNKRPADGICQTFAAGAMLYVTVNELIPGMQTGENVHRPLYGYFLGFFLMMAMDTAL